MDCPTARPTVAFELTWTHSFLAAYERLAPFGNGNPEPVFLAHDVRLCAPPRTIKERHLGLSVAQEGGRTWRATAWSRRTVWAERARTQGWTTGSRFEIAFRLCRNWHPQFGGWELEVEQMELIGEAPDPPPRTK